jgi:hypothetical protein
LQDKRENGRHQKGGLWNQVSTRLRRERRCVSRLSSPAPMPARPPSRRPRTRPAAIRPGLKARQTVRTELGITMSLGMSLGRRRSLRIALLGSLLLLGTAVAVTVVPSTANAAVTVQIRLTNASTYCINVTHNDHVSGETLNLWNCSTGGSGTWNLITGLTCIEGQQSNCVEFQDPHKTSLCIGAPVDSDDYLTLQSCAGNNSRTSWYSEGGGHIGSGAYGSSHTMASDGATNGSLLAAMTYPPPIGFWWTWTY